MKKRDLSCDAKNVKIRLSKHPKIEDMRCQLWRDIGLEKGKNLNFGLAKFAFLGCVYDCKVRAERVVNQTSYDVCPLKKKIRTG